MKINKTLALLVVASVAYGVSSGSIYAQIVPAVLPPSPGGGVTIYSDAAVNAYNLGFVFTPTHSFGVNYLGFYDENGQGLSIQGSQTVAIYNSSGGVIYQTSIDPSSAVLYDNYYWAAIPTLQLTAGSTYTVDAYYNGVNPWGASTPLGSMLVNSAITSVSPMETGAGGGLADPTTAGLADYYGPNLSIDGVPDGSLTVILLGMALAGLGCIRRKLA